MFKGCGGKLLIGFVWDRDFVLFADGTGCMEVMMETKQEAKQENQFGGFSLGWEILRCLFFLNLIVWSFVFVLWCFHRNKLKTSRRVDNLTETSF